ncbi:hypothetical protein MMKA1_08980 [Methanococcus maripaludis KA1]|uniref:RHS repeat-associated core domain-containing protein n=1 Tax=Methanococcus maripaludis KA1 TaxID=637914 RepID=A0A2Z5PHY1_METMI|nr:RHS repeat-associated core domain-containing protein [Methanococcus maripaludis]BAP61015.1 hypothetical protein MMKA1_08980 [Methanococcus maripaludis KA1]
MGSTNLLVNESGIEVERTEYFPYGQVQFGGSEKYGFTGQENDADTGLMYYGARYYSPEYRIFIQPDTMLPDPYNPQALNRYAYTLNNPVKYTDPDGHMPQIVVVAVVAAGVGFVGSLITQYRAAEGDWSQISLSEAAAVGMVTSISATVGFIVAGAAVATFAVGTLDAVVIGAGVEAMATNVCQETVECNYEIGDSEFDLTEIGMDSATDFGVSLLCRGASIDVGGAKHVEHTDNAKPNNYNQVLDTGKEVLVQTGAKSLIDVIHTSEDDDSDKKKDKTD